MVARINDRFASARRQPIELKIAHHQPDEVYEYYRAAEVCMVTSLHDGMNLVAKEFISSRTDERGVLILSRFTGAARELPEALIVNPYDTDECAAALHLALSMPAGEQRARIRLMRGLIQDFNVYRWAGRMLIDAAAMRRRGRLLERATAPEARPPGSDDPHGRGGASRAPGGGQGPVPGGALSPGAPAGGLRAPPGSLAARRDRGDRGGDSICGANRKAGGRAEAGRPG